VLGPGGAGAARARARRGKGARRSVPTGLEVFRSPGFPPELSSRPELPFTARPRDPRAASSCAARSPPPSSVPTSPPRRSCPSRAARRCSRSA
jgi:hypothetical protein